MHGHEYTELAFFIQVPFVKIEEETNSILNSDLADAIRAKYKETDETFVSKMYVSTFRLYKAAGA